MGVPYDEIPSTIIDGCQYDKDLIKFGKDIINAGKYIFFKAPERRKYKEYGTNKDSLLLRLDNNYVNGFQPLIRAHSGPYHDDKTRAECLSEYHDWCRILSKEQLLDILSIGSSQLSQSNFGENWSGLPNGGGVPVNSEIEYYDIWKAARPMLVRTYSGTKNISALAEMYEKTINNAWHALSLWWFNELDGRGPNSLYKNLIEHLETIHKIALIGKPVETNVPHHFAFRGSDDVTYILSGFLAAKAAKKQGVTTFVLQIMLNTPRSTWGIQDLAKSRVLLKLVKELEDERFRVIVQTRAGLDYFKPELETAKAQLAAVTAMMDDIDPDNIFSPEIIHVVSYSEALYLATPSIINDSIRITRTALNEYRSLKMMKNSIVLPIDDIYKRQLSLETSCRTIIKAMEDMIPNLYSAKGLYLAFVGGWLPVPDLWTDSDEFTIAKSWATKAMNGGIALCDKDIVINTNYRINKCAERLKEAQYIFKHKYC